MTIREQAEILELSILDDNASLSSRTKGRKIPERKCDIRTEYQRDRDRIIHCNAFRRLKHKTQVFLTPIGDHYRTRLTHTLEVSQIARTISRALRLNEDLTEAIALGHDLGHTPFGHSGESVLDEMCADVGGFKHYIQSVNVVEYIEKDGNGLNLTHEVIDGIANHTDGIACTLEGNVVRLSDKIAYINHDIEDAIRAGIIKTEDLPALAIEVLGSTKSQRITTLVKSIIHNSNESIKMGNEVRKAHDELRCFMFENVYINSVAKSEEKKAQGIVRFLFNYFYNAPKKLPYPYNEFIDKYGLKRAVSHYIAGMTDGYAIDFYSQLCIPKGWNV